MGKLLPPPESLPPIGHLLEWTGNLQTLPSRLPNLCPNLPTRSDAYNSTDPFSSLGDFGKGIVD